MTSFKPKYSQKGSFTITVELTASQMEALDRWIAHSGNTHMPRPEAIRHILSKELCVSHRFMDHPHRASAA